MNYYDMNTQEVLSQLDTSMNGLTGGEAESRLSRYGKNEITEQKKKGVLRVFAEQFADLLVIILIISALVSVFTDNIESAIVIICVITMNAVLGTVQHFKAEKSLEALKSMSSPTAKVMRDNNIHIVRCNRRRYCTCRAGRHCLCRRQACFVCVPSGKRKLAYRRKQRNRQVHRDADRRKNTSRRQKKYGLHRLSCNGRQRYVCCNSGRNGYGAWQDCRAYKQG